MADIRIYTTSYCAYCHLAKALLRSKQVAFEEIDCTRDPQVRQWLVEQTGLRTVPQVFIRDVPVGGFDELRELDEAGELDPILSGERMPAHV
jgi:glutaredoxin 3